jgi:hypothetical protein
MASKTSKRVFCHGRKVRKIHPKDARLFVPWNQQSFRTLRQHVSQETLVFSYAKHISTILKFYKESIFYWSFGNKNFLDKFLKEKPYIYADAEISHVFHYYVSNTLWFLPVQYEERSYRRTCEGITVLHILY